MEDKILSEKLNKYIKLTEKALEIAKNNIKKKNEAEEIIKMVEAYVSDTHYFKKQGDLINAFAAINYAHGWLDAGARLGIFDVKNTRLFTIK